MTKTEQTRLWRWRFKVLQPAGETSRKCGANLSAFRHLPAGLLQVEAAFDKFGAAGLYDRPRAPRHSPRATPTTVVSKILYLRQTCHFGPGKIEDYLRRLHQVTVARSTVHRLLGRHGMNRLPANQKHRPHRERWQRYEKPRPGHRLQLDVKSSSGGVLGLHSAGLYNWIHTTANAERSFSPVVPARGAVR